MAESLTIRIARKADYRFEVDFGEAIAGFQADLPPPLGAADGPSPEHLLLAAVANCLSASLVFALRKFKQDAGDMVSTLTCTLDRNEQRRLRVTAIDADINLGRPADGMEHLDRVLDQFESFCTVTQSVQAGIPVRVTVVDSTGRTLKSPAS